MSLGLLRQQPTGVIIGGSPVLARERYAWKSFPRSHF